MVAFALAGALPRAPASAPVQRGGSTCGAPRRLVLRASAARDGPSGRYPPAGEHAVTVPRRHFVVSAPTKDQDRSTEADVAGIEPYAAPPHEHYRVAAAAASVESAPPPPPPPPAAGRWGGPLGLIATALSLSLSALLLFTIPAIMAMREAALEMAALVRDIRREVPDTMATVRLTGLELTDAVEELGELSSDLSGGIRSAARSISAAEAGARGAGVAARSAMKEHVVPAVRGSVVPAVEGAARANARMKPYSSTAVVKAARSTAKVARRARKVLAAGSLAAYGYGAASVVGMRRAARQTSSPAPPPGPDPDAWVDDGDDDVPNDDVLSGI